MKRSYFAILAPTVFCGLIAAYLVYPAHKAGDLIFQEGDFKLYYPVKAKDIIEPQTDTGKIGAAPTSVEIANNNIRDGGTKTITILDGKGQIFTVYIDHQLGDELYWGTISINGKRTAAGAITVSKQTDLRTVLKPIFDAEGIK